MKMTTFLPMLVILIFAFGCEGAPKLKDFQENTPAASDSTETSMIKYNPDDTASAIDPGEVILSSPVNTEEVATETDQSTTIDKAGMHPDVLKLIGSQENTGYIYETPGQVAIIPYQNITKILLCPSNNQKPYAGTMFHKLLIKSRYDPASREKLSSYLSSQSVDEGEKREVLAYTFTPGKNDRHIFVGAAGAIVTLRLTQDGAEIAQDQGQLGEFNSSTIKVGVLMNSTEIGKVNQRLSAVITTLKKICPNAQVIKSSTFWHQKSWDSALSQIQI